MSVSRATLPAAMALTAAAVLVACGGPKTSTENFVPQIMLDDNWNLTFDSNEEALFETHDIGPEGALVFLYPMQVFDLSSSNQVIPAPQDMAEWIRDHRRLAIVEETEVEVAGYTGIRLEATAKNLVNFPLLATSRSEHTISFTGHAYFYVLNAESMNLIIYAAPRDAALFPHFASLVEASLDAMKVTTN